MKTIMLHYVNEKLVRSPNIICNRIENNEVLKDKYNFVHLNQDKLPSKDGNFTTIIDLYKKIKKNNPDVIHVSGVKEGFHCIIAATLAKVPNKILITHGFAYKVEKNYFKRILFYIIEIITVILSTYIQCNSLFSKNNPIIKRFANKKSVVIYNLVDQDPVGSIHKIKEKYKIKNDDFIIYCAGRLIETKGFDVIADVILRFRESKDIKFIVSGKGSYQDEFINKVKNQIDSGQVIYTGNIENDELLKLMKLANVFFLPTRHYETFGLVFIEAAFQSTISLTTNSGAVSEVVINDVTGFIVNNPYDIDEFEKKLNYINRNIDMLKQMNESAQKNAMSMFNAKKIGDKIDELYKK